MQQHVVKQGECMLTIAERHGFGWRTLWDHPENLELRHLRADPNVLYAGDIVKIPDKLAKQVPCATGARHHFELKTTRARVKIRLMVGDQPLTNTPCKLEVDGTSRDCRTDSGGFVIADIPASAVHGCLVFDVFGHEQRFEIELGALDPITETSGAQQRLSQLGFDSSRDLEAAVRSFQEKYKLAVSGAMNDETRNALKSAYGQ